MLAMQYSFTLPADYEMAIIRQRIAERGHLTDGFPDLAFKAYLYNRRVAGDVQRLHNRYAPFYLWRDVAGLNAFLSGPGFAALVQSFGRPSIQTWPVWAAYQGPQVAMAQFATREVVSIPDSADLGAWRAAAEACVAVDGDRTELVASVIAFEPSSWTQVHLRLWRTAPTLELASEALCYDVGHVSAI